MADGALCAAAARGLDSCEWVLPARSTAPEGTPSGASRSRPTEVEVALDVVGPDLE
jgi:hypothetical protein